MPPAYPTGKSNSKPVQSLLARLGLTPLLFTFIEFFSVPIHQPPAGATAMCAVSSAAMAGT
ncbi:hypothetical protein QC763_0011340 [Podospora pseudopauciseta]|uniref:Uncharacterized protein n=1 Tax=Podospora pseudopauciseta TaxID=2093780 RepID=A0ABR0HYJ9_9PEZI|nr:hypothetical protein QC763_0011340 [Podospora pseudopauciseta]